MTISTELHLWHVVMLWLINSDYVGQHWAVALGSLDSVLASRLAESSLPRATRVDV